MDGLRGTFQLGERRDGHPGVVGLRVIDLEQQRLVGLHDQRAVGHCTKQLLRTRDLPSLPTSAADAKIPAVRCRRGGPGQYRLPRWPNAPREVDDPPNPGPIPGPPGPRTPPGPRATRPEPLTEPLTGPARWLSGTRRSAPPPRSADVPAAFSPGHAARRLSAPSATRPPAGESAARLCAAQPAARFRATR